MLVLRKFAVALAAVAVALGLAAAPSGAQPNRQQGLVNVYAEDVTVQIPIAVAANVCGIAVNVLVSQLEQGDVDCTAEGVAIADAGNDNGNDGVRQEGLVNVALVDVTVQVPVAVAANICGVAVNVLAQNGEQGGVDCEAIAEAGAQG
jgi:putative N-acetylmannosamine-6-phosphate epimerase